MITLAPPSRAASAAQQAALPAPTTITSGFPKSVVLISFLSLLCLVGLLQCNVLGGAARRGSGSVAVVAGAGEAWCATMRQPRSVLRYTLVAMTGPRERGSPATVTNSYTLCTDSIMPWTCCCS